MSENEEERDALFDQAVEACRKSGRCTVTMLREKLTIGYSRALKLKKQIDASGSVDTTESANPVEEDEGKEEEAGEKKYGAKKHRENNNLPCHLTDEELLSYGDESARLTSRLQELEDQKKSFNAQIKQEATQHEARVDQLSQRIREKREYRDIPCERVHDYDAGTVTLIRLDTGEPVSSRKMTEYELAERDSLFHKQEVEEQGEEKDLDYVEFHNGDEDDSPEGDDGFGDEE